MIYWSILLLLVPFVQSDIYTLPQLPVPASNSSLGPTDSACAEGFTADAKGGSCYKLIAILGTFKEAVAKCKSYGANYEIATFRCAEEERTFNAAYRADADVLNPTNEQGHKLDVYMGVWIGLRQLAARGLQSGTWVSERGPTQSRYRNWAPQEPNEGIVAYGATAAAKAPTNEGTWVALDQNKKVWGAVCEQIVTSTGKACRK